MTSGEKINEEFYTEFESTNFNLFKNIGVVSSSSKFDIRDLNNHIQNLKTNFSNKNNSKLNLINDINKIIENFNHIEKGKNLDQSM